MQCGRCDARIPLVAQRPHYRLSPVRRAGTGVVPIVPPLQSPVLPEAHAAGAPAVAAQIAADSLDRPPLAPPAAHVEPQLHEDPVVAAMAEVAAEETIEIPRPVEVGGTVDLADLGLYDPVPADTSVSQEAVDESTESEALESAPRAEAARDDEATPGSGAALRLVSLGVASLLTTGGASSGYYLGLIRQFDPVIGAVVGAAAGLALGWATIRWIVRQS